MVWNKSEISVYPVHNIMKIYKIKENNINQILKKLQKNKDKSIVEDLWIYNLKLIIYNKN